MHTEKEDPASRLARLLRERAELEQELARTLEERAEVRARGRSGPSFGPEGPRQSRYSYEKARALADLPKEDKAKLQAEDEIIAAEAREVPETHHTTGREEQSIDMTRLQQAARALTRGDQPQEHQSTPSPTKDFNRQTDSEAKKTAMEAKLARARRSMQRTREDDGREV